MMPRMIMRILRAIHTVKEKEIWPNIYDTLLEARAAIEAYVNYYNDERRSK